MTKLFKYFSSLSLLAVIAFVPAVTHAANLYLSPAKANVAVGDRIAVKVLVNGNTSMNAVSGVLAIPTSMFTVESLSKTGSVLNFWAAEPSFSRSSGLVKFEGVSLSGFQNSAALALTITLKAIKPGPANISFQTGQVLANDGQGTDITSGFSGASFTIVAPVIKESVSVPIAPVVATTTATSSIVVVDASLLTVPPEIKTGLENGVKVIKGLTDYPKTPFNLTFISVDGSKIFISGLTDEQGRFSLVVPAVLRSGAYAVNAVILLGGNRQPLLSNVLAIEIGHPIYLEFSWEVITYIAGGIIILLLLILTAVLLKKNRVS